jgi:hypothetical protein
MQADLPKERVKLSCRRPPERTAEKVPTGAILVSTFQVYLIGGLIFVALAAVAIVAGYMLNSGSR